MVSPSFCCMELKFKINLKTAFFILFALKTTQWFHFSNFLVCQKKNNVPKITQMVRMIFLFSLFFNLYFVSIHFVVYAIDIFFFVLRIRQHFYYASYFPVLSICLFVVLLPITNSHMDPIQVGNNVVSLTTGARQNHKWGRPSLKIKFEKKK